MADSTLLSGERERWTNLSLALIGIALGIIAKFLYEYTIKYLRAKNKANVRFDWKGFGLTVILSGFLAIVMYSGLLSAVVKLENNLLVLSVAAQNGFFWQTIIDKLSEEKTKMVLPGNLAQLISRKVQAKGLETDGREK